MTRTKRSTRSWNFEQQELFATSDKHKIRAIAKQVAAAADKLHLHGNRFWMRTFAKQIRELAITD